MTIKERADNYYREYINSDADIHDAYFDGATEQKAIDEADFQTAKQTYFDAGYEKGVSKTIDKAWDYVYYLYANLAHLPHCRIEEKKNDFIKAMEE